MSLVNNATPIGWIGTGVMGSSMCGHLLRKGHPVTVHNRTRAKAEPLLAAGAIWADSPRALAEQSEIVFTIVGYPVDVRETVLGKEGALAGCSAGTVLVDMTTSQPTLAIEIAEKAETRGVHSIDAPVSGGDVGAREARLSIMVGGDQSTFDRILPLFEALGETVVLQGGPGAGQHTKMVNQILVATNMIGVCESLLYAQQAGLDLNRVLESVGSGAASSWSLLNLAPRIIDGNFDPGFYVEHFIKDMEIALEESQRMGLTLPGLALAEQLYQSVKSMGHGRLGTHALQLALAKLSNVDWKSIA